MGNSEQRRQKKLAKAKAKRTDKRATLAKQTQPNHRLLLKQVETLPFHEALVPTSLWQRGLGQLILSRKLPDGRIAFACILLDVWCLGVKSSFFRVEYLATYHRMVLEMEQRDPFEKVAPEKLAKIVMGAVAFAGQYGFKPDDDFADCRHVFASIDLAACTEEFSYGRDGKPFYVDGPNDKASRVQEIMGVVAAAGGRFTVNNENLSGGPNSQLVSIDDEDENEENAIHIR